MNNIEIDITGRRFGKLIAVRKDITKKFSDRTYGWIFKCDCGKIITRKKSSVVTGITKSCGCLREYLPKMNGKRSYKTKTYWAWNNVKLFAKKRGLKVCKEWLEFENFLNDMGIKPNNKCLDIIDESKGYCKENCRWVPKKESHRIISASRENSVKYKFKGEVYTRNELADKIGVHRDTITRRIRNGVSPDSRLNTSKILDVSGVPLTGERSIDIYRLRKFGCTLEQIGSIYKLTRERIRQILLKK